MHLRSKGMKPTMLEQHGAYFKGPDTGTQNKDPCTMRP